MNLIVTMFPFIKRFPIVPILVVIALVVILFFMIKLYQDYQTEQAWKERQARYGYEMSQKRNTDYFKLYSDPSKKDEIEQNLEEHCSPLTIRDIEQIFLLQVLDYLDRLQYQQETEETVLPPKGNPIWESIKGTIGKKYYQIPLDFQLTLKNKEET